MTSAPLSHRVCFKISYGQHHRILFKSLGQDAWLDACTLFMADFGHYFGLFCHSTFYQKSQLQILVGYVFVAAAIYG